MICVMARESQRLYSDQSTRETFKMAIYTGLASTLGLMGTDMRAAGRRVRCME